MTEGLMYILIISLTIITVVSLMMSTICFSQYRKLYRTYDRFMRGKDAETLEDLIYDIMDAARYLKEREDSIDETLDKVLANQQKSIQKTGFVKYNAFKGMGGALSFALALLDNTNSGVIINSVHSREGCYIYMRDVIEGKTEVVLSDEEKEALEQALGYK